jgi:hypothetical protein
MYHVTTNKDYQLGQTEHLPLFISLQAYKIEEIIHVNYCVIQKFIPSKVGKYVDTVP